MGHQIASTLKRRRPRRMRPRAKPHKDDSFNISPSFSFSFSSSSLSSSSKNSRKSICQHLRIGLFYFGTSISQKHGPYLQNSSALTCFAGVPQMAPTDNQGCRPLISIAQPRQAKWPSAILHQPQFMESPLHPCSYSTAHSEIDLK